MIWHYTVGRFLTAYIAALQIDPKDFTLFVPSRNFVWLSTNADWEQEGHGGIRRRDGTIARPSKRQLSGIANGLFRVEVDESAGQLHWSDLTRLPGVKWELAEELELAASKIGSIPTEWRFELAAIPQSRWIKMERWDWEKSAWLPESIAGNHLEVSTLEMLGAIDHCMHRRQMIASLILIYSTIDSLAWLNIPDLTTATSERSFCEWLELYLLPCTVSLGCNAIDLYGARCGLLHTRSSISSKSRQGKAKQIMYAWGSRSPDQLQSILDLHPTETALAVHVTELFEGLVKAFGRFLDAMSKDLARSQVARAKAATVFPSALDSLEASQAMKELGLC